MHGFGLMVIASIECRRNVVEGFLQLALKYGDADAY
jgi:hypothetical protein